MKKIINFIFVILFTVSLFGCSPSNDSKSDGERETPRPEAGISGYIMKKEGGRILVINPEAQDFSSTGGVKEFYNAIWFSKAPQDINIGDKVKVWYDIVLDSYPGQSEVKHIEVIPGEKSNGSNLTESEALNKALTSQEIAGDKVTVVKAIEYEKKADVWRIRLKEAWSDKIFNIQVEDKK